ncbi:MAG: hypothetical protein AAGB93_24450, partial [Planctomycetota bacterium]
MSLLVALALALVAQEEPDASVPTAAELRAERMRAFANDLAAESGVSVAFVEGDLVHLRVGTVDGPTVVLLPARLGDADPLSAAFEGDAARAARSIA